MQKRYKIFFGVLFSIVIFQGAYGYISQMCALGSDPSWECTREPLVTMSVSAISFLILMFFYWKKLFLIKIVPLLIFITILPYIVRLGHDILPRSFVEIVYLGVTENACKNGNAVVPWGKLDSKWCFDRHIYEISVCSEEDLGKDRCVDVVAEKKEDALLCRTSTCIENLSLKKLDPTICLLRERGQNYCLFRYANRVRNTEACKMIQQEGSWSAEICLNCSQIFDWKQQRICVESFKN